MQSIPTLVVILSNAQMERAVLQAIFNLPRKPIRGLCLLNAGTDARPAMPDASTFSTWERDALARISALRRRADEHRAIAKSVQAYGGTSWADCLFTALKFDSRADIIAEAMKRGKTVPKVDFGDEPFRG